MPLKYSTSIFSLLFFILLLPFSGYSQSEIKIYGGYNDYPGLAYEYTFENHISIEVSASFRSKNDGLWHGLTIRDNNMYINGMFKKYHSNKKGKTIFFYGAYLRHWYTNHFASKATVPPIPESIQTLLDSNHVVTHATKTHKLSIGFLAGYKFPIKEKFTFGITTGVGFSLPSMFWEKTYSYNQEPNTYKVGDDSFIGYLNHLSLIGQLSFGYKFGQ